MDVLDFLKVVCATTSYSSNILQGLETVTIFFVLLFFAARLKIAEI